MCTAPRICLRGMYSLNPEACINVEHPSTKSRMILLDKLKVCNSLQMGKELHVEAIKSGNSSSIYVATALANMYTRCGSIPDALQVFNTIKHPDVVAWSSLIFGCANNGAGLMALDLYSRMKSQGSTPDFVTFLAALKACTSLAQSENGREKCREWGRHIHSDIGCCSDIKVQSSLVDMYAKCGCMDEARRVFDTMKSPNVVSWNVLVLGYTENGEGEIALDIFARMKAQGYKPDAISFFAALKACSSIAVKYGERGKEKCRERGKQLHLEVGSSPDIRVQGSLIDMYSKCGCMSEAREVFDAVKNPDVVMWSSLILGFVENGEGAIALNLFERMKREGPAANEVTFVAALKACGLLGALECGKKIHAEIHSRIEGNVILVTCLVDFYAKCGSLTEAQIVFDSHPQTRNMITWTALLAGYSHRGDTNAVFKLFQQMQDEGFQPNSVTFLCILACCNYAGLVGEAQEVFETMSTKFQIIATIEHCNSMIDVLGRLNKLGDAIFMLRSMSCRPTIVTWMTLLSASRKWKNAEIGSLAFQSVLMLDDTNATAHVLLMGHLYGSLGMWKEREMVLSMRQRFSHRTGKTCWTNEMGDSNVLLDC